MIFPKIVHDLSWEKTFPATFNIQYLKYCSEFVVDFPNLVPFIVLADPSLVVSLVFDLAIEILVGFWCKQIKLVGFLDNKIPKHRLHTTRTAHV